MTEGGDGPMGVTRLRLGKPVIAAIEGHAVAGGLEVALWCDLRVAARDAVLGVYCRRFGVPLVDLGTVRLPRLIGHSRAMDLILTGRGVDGEEALAMGLVNRLTEPGAALGRRASSWPASWRPSRRPACAAIGCPRSSSGGSPRTRRRSTSSATAWRRSTAARPSPERSGSPAATAATGSSAERYGDAVQRSATSRMAAQSGTQKSIPSHRPSVGSGWCGAFMAFM